MSSTSFEIGGRYCPHRCKASERRERRLGIDRGRAGRKIPARGALYARSRPKMAGEARANLCPGHRAAIGPMHGDATEVGGRPHGVVTCDEPWGRIAITRLEWS